MDSSLKERLNQIDKQIQELSNKRFFLEKQLQLENHLNNLELVGKCFEEENFYYRVVSLIVNNPYRCLVLKIRKDNQISFPSKISFRDYVDKRELNEINFESFGIEITSVMIKDLDSLKKISLERFERELLKKFSEIPNMLKKLKQIQAAAASSEFELNKENCN